MGSRVCAVIPAHDEAVAVAPVVRRALEQVAAVIVVDDGSRDGTAELARSAGAWVIRWPRRRGKGAALRAGLEVAFARGFHAAVTLDGDGQHLPEEIPRFLEAHERGAELVIGDRTRHFARMPLARRWANQVLTAILRPLAGAAVHDSQCGFRLISARLYRLLDLRCRHFDLESEVLIAAHRAGVEAVHVPVSAVYGNERSKIRAVPDAFRFLRLVARAARSRHKPCLKRSAPALSRL